MRLKNKIMGSMGDQRLKKSNLVLIKTAFLDA